MEYIGEELATHSWTNLEDRMQFELDGCGAGSAGGYGVVLVIEIWDGRGGGSDTEEELKE